MVVQKKTSYENMHEGEWRGETFSKFQSRARPSVSDLQQNLVTD